MPRRPGRSARVIFAGLALATLAGCPSKPPPPPPPPPPAPAPPPPPPPCEELTEKCKAKKSTLIPIPTSRWVFNPPKGWVYAKYDDASVAEASGEGAAMIFRSMKPVKQKWKRRKQRSKLVDDLAKEIGVKRTRPVQWFRSDPLEVSTLTFKLWEVEATRGGEKGWLVIFSAPVEGVELFGVGWAADKDEDGSKGIVGAIKSVTVGDAPEGDDDDDKKKKKKKGIDVDADKVQKSL